MQKKKYGYLLLFVSMALAVFSLFGLYGKDIASKVNLGLDLQGGFEILYEVQPLDETQVIDETALKGTVSSLDKRVNQLGVSEPTMQIEGEDRIRVQIAGIKDEESAREMLSTQAELTFRDLEGNLLMGGSNLKEGGASVQFDQFNNPLVSVTLKDPSLFAEATKKTLGSQLVMWMDYEEGDEFQEEVGKEDSKIISYPNVSEILNTSQIQISGGFTVEEANDLASLLNAGALPVKLEEIYSNTVSAQFGQSALEETVMAAAIGVLLIFIYMLFYYRTAGIVAVTTLTAYILIILSVFNWMNAVLTLPGIAALVLGVGMAVDANILTYERIKESLREKKSISDSVLLGSKNALGTIVDSNLTTLIATGVLFMFGTSSVKGFALMLSISILVSFVTAVFGSRLMLSVLVKSNALEGKKNWIGLLTPRFSFRKLKKEGETNES